MRILENIVNNRNNDQIEVEAYWNATITLKTVKVFLRNNDSRRFSARFSYYGVNLLKYARRTKNLRLISK